MTKRQMELIRLAAEVDAGDEGTAWRDRLEIWLRLQENKYAYHD